MYNSDEDATRWLSDYEIRYNIAKLIESRPGMTTHAINHGMTQMFGWIDWDAIKRELAKLSRRGFAIGTGQPKQWTLKDSTVIQQLAVEVQDWKQEQYEYRQACVRRSEQGRAAWVKRKQSA